MDYEPFDSSGTDDDLPPAHQNRVRATRVTGNGRPTAVRAVQYPMYNDSDMQSQIHQLELEAYSSVLRAFQAQADAISWDREELMSELRKELRLSNEEHRDLISRVNSDNVIRRIREWRRAGGLQPGVLSSNQAICDPGPSPPISAPRKKQKMNQEFPPQPFAGPSPSFQPTASNHPLTNIKRGSSTGLKGKKYKPDHTLPALLSMKSMQYSSSGIPGRNQVNRTSAVLGNHVETAASDQLIGRKVKSRWPDDNNFYEAVITDYNPDEGRLALVYDIGSAEETWEWVNLSEISPEDLQWEGEDPGIVRRGGGYGRSGHGVNKPPGIDGSARVGGTTKSQFRNNVPSSQNGIGKRDNIRLLHTDTLIKEVERIFGSRHPDLVETEKAKRMLKEHEEALVDAIQKLTEISDDEKGRQFPRGL